MRKKILIIAIELGLLFLAIQIPYNHFTPENMKPIFLWVTTLINILVIYKTTNKEIRPKINNGTHKEIYSSLYLSILQVYMFGISVLIISSLISGISTSEIVKSYSSISIYIGLFSIYSCNQIRILLKTNRINTEKLLEKYGVILDENKADDLVLCLIIISSAFLVINSIIFYCGSTNRAESFWFLSFIIILISIVIQIVTHVFEQHLTEKTE